MALCHLPSFSSLYNPYTNQHLKWGTLHCPPRKNPIFSCSSHDKSRKKGKSSSRSVKSNKELCHELREFMLEVGIEENRAPSMKELSDNGRKDLAFIVRRRGYKLITELLMNSVKSDSDTEKPSIDDQNFNYAGIDESSEIQEIILIEAPESVSSPTGSSMLDNYMDRTNGAVATNSSDQIYESAESSVLSLHSRAANFVQTGKFDIFEEASETETGEMPTDSEHKSGDISSYNTDDTAYSDSQESPNLLQKSDRDQVMSRWGLEDADNNENLTSEAGEKIDPAEINHLKAMLLEKEKELLELKREIENEKQSLSILQDEANKVIGNADRIATEEDVELSTGEKSLSGLKEVQIEYWGIGEIVEVAGSFNGWHNRIRMDLHPSSLSVFSLCPRGLKLWSTILWLYPGIYEIKFVVDGIWKIDPNREMTTSSNITNNVLRVDH